MALRKGAEAIVEISDHVSKKRLPKRYRIKELDEELRKKRTKTEAKIIAAARKAGVPTPIILDISGDEITMERIRGELLRDEMDERLSEKVGEIVGKLHAYGIIHGDLTTSNMIHSDGKIYLIDFGLAYLDQSTESRGMDVHVLFQTFNSTHFNPEKLIDAFKRGYMRSFPGADQILKRVKDIEKRRRYV